jgi:hypothetical protein
LTPATVRDLPAGDVAYSVAVMSAGGKVEQDAEDFAMATIRSAEEKARMATVRGRYAMYFRNLARAAEREGVTDGVR